MRRPSRPSAVSPSTEPEATTNEEERRYLREGLASEAELAVFDLLQKDSLTKSDREAIKKVAKDLLGKLTNQRFTRQRLRNMATVQAQMKAEIIKHMYEHLPASTYDPNEISLKASAVLAHIYQAGFGEGPQIYH